MRPALHQISCFLLVIWTLTTSVSCLHGADDPPNPDGKPSVFDLPTVQAQHARALRVITALLLRKDYPQAETALRQALERVPHDPTCHYNLACVLARQEMKDEALASLQRAVEFGFRDSTKIKTDDDLQNLRDDKRYPAILELAAQPLLSKPGGWNYQVDPAAVDHGRAVVDENNSAWNPQIRVFQSYFRIDRTTGSDKPIAVGLGEVGDLLRSWDAQGTAAGNRGDLYDNHDDGHSRMNVGAHPQFTRIEYSTAARKRQLHYGLQTSLLFNGITIGNSSTAVTTPHLTRSQPRFAMTKPRGAAMLYLQYIGNHLYFYPEHVDHDARADRGRGDLFPANTPYVIVSQGSSGSDRVFMNAVAGTLAAFRPEVKQKLAKNGALMNAVQMIFRISNEMVQDEQDYLSGIAHPSVFDGKQVRPENMIKLAHALTLESLPPVVRLKVVEEDQAVVGRDYFDVGPRERLFDTPCAIARVIKSTMYNRRMVVSAEASHDLNGQPLSFHWVVLRGDADRIQINPLNKTGSRAELIVPYHRFQPIRPGSVMESSRVDIGVIVHNGKYYSAPGFISLSYLANEKRFYDEQQRIRIVDYTDKEFRGYYVDPLLDFPKDWKDEYRYDEAGQLLGWTRTRGSVRQEFTPDGQLVVSRGEGNEVESTPVRYVPRKVNNGVSTLEQVTVERAPSAR